MGCGAACAVSRAPAPARCALWVLLWFRYLCGLQSSLCPSNAGKHQAWSWESVFTPKRFQSHLPNADCLLLHGAVGETLICRVWETPVLWFGMEQLIQSGRAAAPACVFKCVLVLLELSVHKQPLCVCKQGLCCDLCSSRHRETRRHKETALSCCWPQLLPLVVHVWVGERSGSQQLPRQHQGAPRTPKWGAGTLTPHVTSVPEGLGFAPRHRMMCPCVSGRAEKAEGGEAPFSVAAPLK